MTQQEALDILKMGCNVFLTGPPGSGKTFLLNKYIDYLRKQNRRVAVTASTGIAATHLQGTTIHSWSGLGIKEAMTAADIRKLLVKPYLRKHFRETGALIIDEISMLNALQFDAINRICQAFKGSLAPFGGIQVVCSGDFFQLPPVERERKTRLAVESNIWQNMNIKICYLEEQHRHKDSELSNLLQCIRSNAIEESRKLLLNRKFNGQAFSITPTKLYTHNADVDVINNFELSKIDEKELVYRMHSSGNKNVVAALIKSCLAPEKLRLKKGAQVMFVKNNFEKGYVNGTRGRVVGFNKDKLPIVKTFSGSSVIATPTTWKVEEEDRILAEVSQIPLRLAWAITVHKSQGMNLETAEIDLSKCFVEGMGYVALSRLTSLDGLRLVGINELALWVQEKVLVLDKTLKVNSQQVRQGLKKMQGWQIKKTQKKFLNSLPKIERNNIKVKKKDVSTYEKTKTLALAKLSLKEIARQRGLTEGAILSHLEVLAEKNPEIDLQYLQPPQERFEKIKSAFAKTGDLKLAPVREILGQDFSYQEIRLTRLSLKNRANEL